MFFACFTGWCRRNTGGCFSGSLQDNWLFSEKGRGSVFLFNRNSVMVCTQPHLTCTWQSWLKCCSKQYCFLERHLEFVHVVCYFRWNFFSVLTIHSIESGLYANSLTKNYILFYWLFALHGLKAAWWTAALVCISWSHTFDRSQTVPGQQWALQPHHSPFSILTLRLLHTSFLLVIIVF